MLNCDFKSLLFCYCSWRPCGKYVGIADKNDTFDIWEIALTLWLNIINKINNIYRITFVIERRVALNGLLKISNFIDIQGLILWCMNEFEDLHCCCCVG